jgi:hypothetical protein
MKSLHCDDRLTSALTLMRENHRCKRDHFDIVRRDGAVVEMGACGSRCIDPVKVPVFSRISKQKTAQLKRGVKCGASMGLSKLRCYIQWLSMTIGGRGGIEQHSYKRDGFQPCHFRYVVEKRQGFLTALVRISRVCLRGWDGVLGGLRTHSIRTRRAVDVRKPVLDLSDVDRE